MILQFIRLRYIWSNRYTSSGLLKNAGKISKYPMNKQKWWECKCKLTQLKASELKSIVLTDLWKVQNQNQFSMDNYNMLYNIVGNFNQNDWIVMYVCSDIAFVENFIELCPNIKIIQIKNWFDTAVTWWKSKWDK